MAFSGEQRAAGGKFPEKRILRQKVLPALSPKRCNFASKVRDKLLLPDTRPRAAPSMLFELDRHLTKMTARAMASQSLEERQRDIYDSHRHRVFSISYYMTGSELEAEEILRGSFVRAFRQADEPDHAIIDGALVEQLRERAVLQEDEPLPMPSTGYLPQRHNILRTELEEAIRYLPSTERAIFLLMDVEGYPANRVAELLNMSHSAVLRAALTARMRLRDELAGTGQSGQEAA
jgi:RNA polymerase sigma-70 factor (ECF subfamily)